VARPRGQNGSVEELGRTWRIRYVEERSDGTRVRRSKGGYPSKRAAAKALRGILAKIDDGSHVPESSRPSGRSSPSGSKGSGHTSPTTAG